MNVAADIEKEIAGQKHILEPLKAAILSKTQPHAQLFIDENGYGGLPLALYCAILLLYSQEQLDHKLQQKNVSFHRLLEHPDFHALFPLAQVKSADTKSFFQQWLKFVNLNPYASYTQWLSHADLGVKQGIIPVKEIQTLQSSLSLTSFLGGNRVCVIWGLDKMNETASNKILKLLEEPPSNTYFLLVAQLKSSLLPTIISRCQFIDMPPVDLDSIQQFVAFKKLNPPHNFDLRTSRGSVSQLIDILNLTTHNKPIEQLFVEFLRNSFDFGKNHFKWHKLLKTIDKITLLQKENQKGLLLIGIELLRQAYLTNCELNSLVYHQSESGFNLTRFAPYVHERNYIQMIKVLEDHITYLIRNSHSHMVFTSIALKLSSLLHL